MKNFLKNFKQIFESPDGRLSSKRVMAGVALLFAGLSALFTFIIMFKIYKCVENDNIAMYNSLSVIPMISIGIIGLFLGYSAACLGITSYDNKNIINGVLGKVQENFTKSEDNNQPS
jgi:hypothetical protein